MIKKVTSSVQIGDSKHVRTYATAMAAFLVALFAIFFGALHVAVAVKFAPNLVDATEDRLHFLLGDGELLIEGFLLIALSVLLTSQIYDRLRTRDKLKNERKSYIEGRSRVGFQIKALNEHAMISEADTEGRFLYVNENWKNTFGYTSDEVIGHKNTFMLDESNAAMSIAEIRRRVKSGEVITSIQHLRSKSGKLVTAHTTVLPKLGANDEYRGTIAIRTDITAIRQSENDRFLKSILKGLQEELYIFSVQDRDVLFMNDLALKRMDWTLDEAKSKQITDTSQFFDMAVFDAFTAPLLAGEEHEVCMQAKHEKCYVEITMTLQSQQDGTPIFVALLRDITHAKMEEKRRVQNVATVSHELRSPMTSIKGSLRLLKSGAAGVLDKASTRLVDIADRNSDRMLMVLNDILDFEKIVANKMEYNLTPLRVTDLVHDAIEMNDGYGVQHDVKFFEGDKIDLAWVAADQGRLMQVMTNLMSNAAKFSPKGGQVVVAISDQENQWRVSVSDDGPGIAPEDYDKVFQSFIQLTPTDGKARKGTGLGLAISAKIIKAHKGELAFESDVGKGTTFYFDLPKTNMDDLPDNKDMVLAAE